MTLKELWESKGLSSTQVAGKADVSLATLYAMNKKQKVSARSVFKVCKALEITKEEFNQLQADVQ